MPVMECISRGEYSQGHHKSVGRDGGIYEGPERRITCRVVDSLCCTPETHVLCVSYASFFLALYKPRKCSDLVDLR